MTISVRITKKRREEKKLAARKRKITDTTRLCSVLPSRKQEMHGHITGLWNKRQENRPMPLELRLMPLELRLRQRRL